MMDLRLPRRRVTAGVFGLVLLGGCSFLFPPSAPQLYQLASRTGHPPSGPPVRGQLVVVPPVAAGDLDTERIALVRNRTMVDYFANAAWTDRAPFLLQGLMVDAFENSGRLVAVGRSSSDLAPDFLLETELRAFQAQYMGTGNEPPTVVVSLVAQVVRVTDRKVIGHLPVSAQTPAARNDLSAIVEAFDTAVGEVLAQIVEWTLRTMVRAKR
jgi:cholesterol transport system auxiliary component